MYARTNVGEFMQYIILQLSYEDVVKIADVDADGVEAAYTAPELISSSFYDGQVDIYSFGIVMWEMWYGKRAFSELQEDLAGKVVEGQRPSHVVGQRKPPNAWENLFQRCWAAQPENRPTAEMCQDELTALCESLFEEQ